MAGSHWGAIAMNNLLPKGVINANFSTDINNLVCSFLSGRKTSTISAYRQDLHEFCRFLKVQEINKSAEILLSLSLGEANALALKYKIYLVDILRLQSATVNRRLAAVRSLVKLARTLGIVSWNLEIKNQEHRAYRDVSGLQAKDLQKIFESLQNKDDPKSIRDLAIMRLLLDLGLRRNEVISLDLEDLDFQSDKIWILGKGHSQKEVLQLPDLTKKTIQAWINIRGSFPGALFFRLDKASSGKMKRLTGTGLYSIVKYLGAEVGLKSITVHKLRHSAISNCCEVIRENGLRIESVLKFSRHKNLNTALIYFDFLENQQGQLADLVSKKIK